jgi:hypothetical protein
VKDGVFEENDTVRRRNDPERRLGIIKPPIGKVMVGVRWTYNEFELVPATELDPAPGEEWESHVP